MSKKIESSPENRDFSQQRTKELQALVQVAQLIKSVDLDYVLLQTMQLTREVSGALKGSLFLLDDDLKPTQRFITQRDLPPETSQRVASEVLAKGLAGWCARAQKSAILADVTQDMRWHTLPDDPQTDIKTALCVPILHEGKTLGVMTLVHDQADAFSEHDLAFVDAVANQASSAIRNTQLIDTLKSQQKQLEFLFYHHVEALFTLTADLKIQMANSAAQTLLNPEGQGTIVGASLVDLAKDTPFEEIRRKISQKTDQGILEFEIRHDEKALDLSVKVNQLDASAERLPNGYLVMIHDVTTIKDFDRLKTQMLHMLTHDLKNPVNIIWGYIDLLRIDSQSNQPTDQRFIDGILRALHRMDALINETLQAERFMAAGEPRPIKVFSPKAIIEEAIDDNKDAAANKQIDLLQHISTELADVEGVAVQIREVMNNLINNAIKYTASGGKVNIHAEQKDGKFRFYVVDTGIGIPKEMQPSLFKEFYRASRPEIKEIAGTGLGLSLVKTIIENHGGDVWFESEAGKGSTFGFWLPLAAGTT